VRWAALFIMLSATVFAQQARVSRCWEACERNLDDPRVAGAPRPSRTRLIGWGRSADATIRLVDAVVDDLDAGVNDALASLGPVHPVAVEMGRRLLLESFADDYEDAIGHFLAAQDRCIRQTEFLRNLKT
jgi:hypothetical protein